MQSRNLLGVLLCFAAAVPATTPESSDQYGWHAAHQRHLRELAEVLSTSNNPRELYVAARLLQSGDRWVDEWTGDQPSIVADRASLPQRDVLMRRALELGHDDPVLWWSAALFDCPASPDVCHRSRAIARLRELAPDNAAVWLLLDASERGVKRESLAMDADNFDARLERAVDASSFDTYFGDRLRMYLDAFEALPIPAELLQPMPGVMAEPTPEAVRAIAAFGLHLADATPDWRPVLDACRLGATTELAPGRPGLCLRAARIAIDDADTLLDLSLLSRLMLDLLPQGEERQSVMQARIAREWQQMAMVELMNEGGGDAVAIDLLMEHWRKPEATELSVMHDLLHDGGIALNPPPGWRSWRETEAVDSVAQPER